MARKILKDEETAVADGENYDYDLFVIGAGSGGVRGSRTSASFGAKVGFFFVSLPPFDFPILSRVFKQACFPYGLSVGFVCV